MTEAEQTLWSTAGDHLLRIARGIQDMPPNDPDCWMLLPLRVCIYSAVLTAFQIQSRLYVV